MTNTTDTENYRNSCRPRVLHMFVLRVKVQYTIKVIYMPSCAVVSTEQYEDPPLFDLRFPDELDLINYTMRGDISDITIPPSLVQERLGERTTNGM